MEQVDRQALQLSLGICFLNDSQEMKSVSREFRVSSKELNFKENKMLKISYAKKSFYLLLLSSSLFVTHTATLFEIGLFFLIASD